MNENRITVIDGQTYVEVGEEVQKNMDTILSLIKTVHARPLTEKQCQIMLDTIVDMQFAYSDDIADFEDVLRAVIDFLELFETRLSGSRQIKNPSAVK